jgi:hypothetical protein
MDVFLEARSSGEPVFAPGQLLFLLLPIYAGVVVLVFRFTGRKKDDSRVGQTDLEKR